MKACLDIEEYGKRICQECCEFYRRTKDFQVQSTEELKAKWNYLFYEKCIDCPLEALLQCLREERDQNMKLQYEYDLEVV